MRVKNLCILTHFVKKKVIGVLGWWGIISLFFRLDVVVVVIVVVVVVDVVDVVVFFFLLVVVLDFCFFCVSSCFSNVKVSCYKLKNGDSSLPKYNK